MRCEARSCRVRWRFVYLARERLSRQRDVHGIDVVGLFSPNGAAPKERVTITGNSPRLACSGHRFDRDAAFSSGNRPDGAAPATGCFFVVVSHTHLEAPGQSVAHIKASAAMAMQGHNTRDYTGYQ